MRLPLGFGKKGYFRLASIQASTIEYKTKRHQTRLIHTTRLFADTCDEEIIEDDPPPLTAVAFLGFVSSYRPRICKCSRLFAKRAHSARLSRQTNFERSLVSRPSSKSACSP